MTPPVGDTLLPQRHRWAPSRCRQFDFSAEHRVTRVLRIETPLSEPRVDFEFAALYPAHRSVSPVAPEFIDGFRTHVSDFLRRRPWR
ncbi:MAG: hypothetical protein ISP49_09770 [Reyranella sp.]|nr:hypothetical protein [Reyranella sp.]MBL6651869.1 hypothetical protein [Reyranella sp.]